MTPYQSPKEAGGQLIRKVLAQFKLAQFPYPLQGKVCIAVSGGVDSVVLAHLMIHYGRKLLSVDQLSLLHIDHGWRAESGGIERETVRELALRANIPFLTRDFKVPENPNTNREADARAQRVALYETLCSEEGGFDHVLTAHHRDDLAETIFWRFLRGELMENRNGILFKDKNVLRPLLQASKELIRSYASEEKLLFFEDPTNQNQDAFRAWYRLTLRPLLEINFPALQKTLAQYAGQAAAPLTPQLDIALIETINRSPLNRAQRAQIDQLRSTQSVGKQVMLAGGVRLTRVKEGFLIESPHVSKLNSSG